jgi:hypothetical protein
MQTKRWTLTSACETISLPPLEEKLNDWIDNSDPEVHSHPIPHDVVSDTLALVCGPDLLLAAHEEGLGNMEVEDIQMMMIRCRQKGAKACPYLYYGEDHSWMASFRMMVKG